MGICDFWPYHLTVPRADRRHSLPDTMSYRQKWFLENRTWLYLSCLAPGSMRPLGEWRSGLISCYPVTGVQRQIHLLVWSVTFWMGLFHRGVHVCSSAPILPCAAVGRLLSFLIILFFSPPVSPTVLPYARKSDRWMKKSDH